MDNPIGSGMRLDSYLNYPQRQAAAGINAKTRNHELGYLNAVFSELLLAEKISYKNLLVPIQTIELSERELPFSIFEQICELLNHRACFR